MQVMTLRELRHRLTLMMEGEDVGAFDTARLTVQYRIIDGMRMFIDARLKQPDWLEKAIADVRPKRPAVEQTVDLHGHEAYLNRMDAYFHGKGYGGEVMMAVLRFLKDRGYARARGYIEHANIASQSMMKKVGAKVQERQEHGSYWSIDLENV